MLLKSASSAALHNSWYGCIFTGTKCPLALLRINASIRCRSGSVVKPHHALDAYCSLATVDRKMVCSAGTDNRVHVWRNRQTVGDRDAEDLTLVARLIPGRGEGNCCFKFTLRRLSVMII